MPPSAWKKKDLKAMYPLIAEVTEHIGDLQVRNAGTIGGGVAHADLSVNMPPVMVIYTLSLHDGSSDLAFPELNAWERAGADASSAGMVDAGFENQKELTKMQLDNQKEIAEMQNETQKEIAGIQSATSRQNTKDQVYAQNEMLAYQQ